MSSRRLAALAALIVSTAMCARPLPAPRAADRVPAIMQVIPAPESVRADGAGQFLVQPSTVLLVSPGDGTEAVARGLRDLIGTSGGPAPLRVESAGASDKAPPGSIALRLTPQPDLGSEGYRLTITPDGVEIAAHQAAGLFFGVQTLRQLLPPWIEYRAAQPSKTRVVSLPAVRIVDRPRFAWRGAMLDVARHFFTVEEVKRYIDLLALYKFNRLHLHLADDQGWRIDITSWPNLARHGGSTEVGGGPGGYYTQDQYADLVAYAAERFITVVPEIDMPGHTNAALASYPELACGEKPPQLYTGIEVGFSALCVEKDVVYTFIDDVVREIAALTRGAYFHVGGDEVKTLDIARYAAFIERVQGIVHAHGKQMIGWDEIADAALAPTSVVQHWRPEKSPAAAVAKGVKVILSPADRVYLDMKYDAQTVIGLSWAGHVDVRKAYDWDPAKVYAGVTEQAVLGIEAPLWSETLDNLRDVEFMAFPRLAAVAEVAWSAAAAREWDSFAARLGAQAPRWSALGVNFYRAPEIPWR